MAQRGYSKGAKKGRSYERILELKSMVDHIINDCSIESKQVREGLKMIKDYQLDVLGEIRDLPEQQEERTYYGPARDTYEPFSRTQQREYEVAPYSDPRTASELTNLREEKINLMNELNGEIRKSNKLAQNYKSLEGDFSKLKREVDRLRRRKHEESSNEGESIIHKMHREEPVRPRTTDDIPTREVPTRHRERYVTAQNYDEVPTRKYERYEDVQSRGKGGEALESQNAKLRDELSKAYRQIDRLNAVIQDLERKLKAADQQINRLQRAEGTRRSPGVQRGSNELMAQLEQLKRQNEDLRVETIRLLKLKGSHGGDSALQDEIDRLQGIIERQNQHKRQFMQDVEKYKRRFAGIEQENKQMKLRIDELTRGGGIEGARYTTSYAAAEYQPRPIYNEMAGVLGDDKLEKYRSTLHGLKNSAGSYGY